VEAPAASRAFPAGQGKHGKKSIFGSEIGATIADKPF
jgi:hypothetical protein